jgi:hypothetical protein
MVAQDTKWWAVIKEVLIGEWGCDQRTLDPNTPLFQEGAGTWMDWVELTQLVLDRVGKKWPHGFELDKVQTGEDLARMLERVVDDPL